MATRLIIKGSMADAISAARARGIPLFRARCNPNHPEVIADTLDTGWTVYAVRVWFAEDRAQAPFPVGTLLWFGTDCASLELMSATRSIKPEVWISPNL